MNDDVPADLFDELIPHTSADTTTCAERTENSE